MLLQTLTLGWKLELPGISSAGEFYGEQNTTETFFSWASFNTLARICHLALNSGKITLFKEPKIKFIPEDHVTRQVFYSSKDSTRISMFITHHHSLKHNGGNPTRLYGYGGFNISLTPCFDDRAYPAHSFKFTAALQAVQAGSSPILIRIETRTGHGAGKPISKHIEETADKLAFLRFFLTNKETSHE